MAENSGINVQFYQRFTLILLFCFVLALIAFVVLAYYFLNDSTHPLGNRPITSGAVWASICHNHPLQRSTSSRLRYGATAYPAGGGGILEEKKLKYIPLLNEQILAF